MRRLRSAGKYSEGIFHRRRIMSRFLMHPSFRAGRRTSENMKDQREYPANDPLRQVLQEWRVETSPPPRFAEGVWRRIELEEITAASPWAALAGWLAQRLARPAFASVLVAGLLATGLAAGIIQAQDKVEHASAQQRSQYLQSVNPYFVAAQHPAAP
jgi:hypothetical protein